MYQPAFVVVPTNQGSVDIRTRFLRIEWTMLLFERQMRDKVAFGYPVHRHNEGTFYIHRHVAERYLTDDGGMLTFFFKMAPRGTVSFNYIEGLDKRKRVNTPLPTLRLTTSPETGSSTSTRSWRGTPPSPWRTTSPCSCQSSVLMCRSPWLKDEREAEQDHDQH